jgi:hypothetical protein
VNPLARVRPGSAVRGAGVALACMMPGLSWRARAVVASYVAGWPLSKPGLQTFVLVPDEDEEPWKRAFLPFATSGASWTVTMLLAIPAVRRTALPTPVAAVFLGGAVAVGDSVLADTFGRMKAEAEAVAAARDSAEREIP